MKKAYLSFSMLALSLCVGSSAVCIAQQVPADVRQVPGSVMQWNQMAPTSNTKEVPDAERPPEPEVETEKIPEPIAPEMTQKFLVNDISVQGVTKIRQGKVEALVRQYEGRELSFLDLRELSEKLTELYRKDGYMTSLVYVPPQRIENGSVLLQAAEGVLGDVTYDPVKYWPERSVLPRISFETGDSFNAVVLKRELRRINDNPDFKLRAVLEAGDEANETNLKLEAASARQPLHVGLFWDNLGRDIIGEQRFGVSTTHNNLFGFGDQAFNSVSWTRRSFATVSHYEVPIGPHGTKIGFDQAYSKLRLGDDFANLNITGRSYVYSGYISQEIVNTDRIRSWMELGFDFKRVNTDLDGDAFTEDKLRVLRPAVNFDAYDSHGRTMMRHELGIGLDLFGATTGDETAVDPDGAASRAGAGGQFLRYTGSITRLQKMPWHSYAIFRVLGQATNDRLVSIEQLQAGGAFTVRGYTEGRVIGDAGYILSGEWRFPFHIFPKSWTVPKTNYVLRDNIQFVTFSDFGAIYTNLPDPGVEGSEYLLGVGVGLRANLTRFLAARVDVGVPLLRQAPDDQQPRLHFGLESRLF